MKKFFLVIYLIAIPVIFALFYVKLINQEEEIKKLLINQEVLAKELQSFMDFEEENYLEKGTIAPEFSLLDQDGKPYVLSEHRNDRKKLLVFSSTECPYCKDFYPILETFTEENPTVDVLIIQDRSTVDFNKSFKDSTNYNFVFLQAKDAVFEAYQITGTPTSVLLSERHTIDTTLIASKVEDLNSIL